MENNQKASLLHIAKITGTLMLITTLTAVLLACINLLTEPVITANETEKKNAAVMELFPEATDVQSLKDDIGEAYPDDISEMYAVYKAGMLLGYCADAQSMGFGDNIGMMIGVNLDNTVRGIRILSISETPGIGMAVAEDAYLDSYTGLFYPIAFDNGLLGADAISGATYSSRAILNGVNMVLEFCSMIVPEDTDASSETETAADDITTEAPTEEVTDNE